MLFSSATFLFLFLPITLGTYFLMPNIKLKNLLLLFVSLVFFAWGSLENLPILLTSIAINYFTGLCQSKAKKHKKAVIIIGVILNLLLLVYYKYLNFLVNSANGLFSLGISLPEIVLPIGISFFTFQGMSYIIDVYRGTVQTAKNPLEVALYIALFPQLIAGPIVKYSDVNEQIKARSVDLNMFCAGLERFIIGLSKKVLISNVMGEAADKIFDLPNETLEVPTAWLGIICYTMQIYFDFSGYSDMAIGLGKLFGFNFNENFRYPYISASITEFWRRWHISLSTWFREYLYIPLGGNRKGNVYLNLFIVFCTTGIWHGADWSFLLWGIWHGIFIIAEKIMMKKGWFDKIPKCVRIPITFLIVMFGWVLFRAADINSAVIYIQHMLGLGTIAGDLTYTFEYYIDTRIITMLIVALIGSTPIMPFIAKKIKSKKVLYAVKTPCLFALLMICIVYIVNGGYNPFIYFQF